MLVTNGEISFSFRNGETHQELKTESDILSNHKVLGVASATYLSVKIHNHFQSFCDDFALLCFEGTAT